MARLHSVVLGGLLTLASCVSGATVATTSRSSSSKRDDFTENLYIQPLPGGYVYYQFEFTTKTAAENSHFELFPRPVAQLASESGIDELYVTLTQGRWLRDTWGPAPNNTEAPTGAEMWAWWPKASASNATLSERWSTLRNAVSGLICASFSTMGDELSSAPSPVVQSGISAKDARSAPRECIHGALPKEATCTENLTPWVRLLPCRDRAGVGALLNPLHLFDVSYHAMSFRILTDASEGTVTLKQTLAIVKRRGSAQGKLSEAFPLLAHQTRPDPSGGVRACPLARESVVRVAGAAPQSLVGADGPADFAIPEGGDIEPRNDVTVHRFATGHGQVGGGFRTVVRNARAAGSPAKVVLFQAFPFFVRPYFSSLKATLDGAPVALGTAPDAAARVEIASGSESGTATTLEIATEIPPGAEFAVEVSFETVFLHFMRHPPDANRGWDLPAGIVVVLPDAQNESPRRLCAEEILLSLPTPDFSMPYNVIMFSCTVVAMFYGGLMSMSTRRMSVAFKNGKLSEETRFMRTWRLIFATVYKFLMSLKNGAAKKLRRWKREKALANGETPEISDDEDDDEDEIDE